MSAVAEPDLQLRAGERKLCWRKRSVYENRSGGQRPPPSFCSHRRADPGSNITDRSAVIPQEEVPFFSYPGDQLRSLA